MIDPATCYEKWITGPAALLKQSVHTPDSTKNLGGKLTLEQRKDTKGAGDKIQAILAMCSESEQFERDVAMWYGYCRDGSDGARFCLRIFSLLSEFGLIYRHASGTWRDFGTDFPQVPVAALLSHGGRILFQLPMSTSFARAVGSTVGAVAKGLTIDPLAATFGRGSFSTLRGSSTTVAVAAHGALRLTGLAALGSLLTIPHKAHSAGDDRLWNYIDGGTVHSRAMATHSTIKTDWSNPAQNKTIENRFLWFTEESAKGSHAGSNINDMMMGRHHYKNLALGGKGNMNPFSGVKVSDDGCHGHMYVNYRPPRYLEFGCILLGVEGSAPGMSNQFGKAHDANATRGEYSATGGRKWGALYPNTFYESTDKGDVTVFVCDLSDHHTSEAKSLCEANEIDAGELHNPISPVATADWAEMVRRVS